VGCKTVTEAMDTAWFRYASFFFMLKKTFLAAA
jgi:hypothetical protein